jgi:uncharacterized protein YndB with AHSA1/START domain
MKRSLILGAVLAGLAGCGPSGQNADRLAAMGKIDDGAPLQAEAEIIINAPPEKIWGLLTDINNWPKWQPDIGNADLLGNAEAGTAFTWRTGDLTIHSVLRLVRPMSVLAWSGEVWFSHAVHVWTIAPFSDGRTVVRAKESMTGWVAAHFYTSMKLQESDLRWLIALKRAAEQ